MLKTPKNVKYATHVRDENKKATAKASAHA
jgi:hypothetical protein